MARRQPAAERQQALDARWNQQLTRLLREAAEVRDRRARARSIEDDLSARREAAALLHLVGRYDPPRTSGPTPRPGPGPRRGSAEMRP